MRTLLSLVAWLTAHAKADIVRIAAAQGGDGAAIGDRVEPNRAGRLVPNQMPEPEVGRSLFAHWALWGAAALILALLAVGYVRRRWRAAARQHSAHVSWARDGQNGNRDD